MLTSFIILALGAALAAIALLRPVAAPLALLALLAPGCSASGESGHAGLLALMALTVVGLVITTNIPTSLFRPGAYFSFVFTTNQRGLTPLPQRVLLVGTMGAGTGVAGTIYQIIDARDSDSYFLQGSPLALMCRKALEQAAFQGTSPEIYAIGIAEPGGGTKHVHTLTFTGPATADGNVVIRIAGRTITTGVQSGQADTVIAAAVQQQIAAQHANLPIVATVALGVVTCTAVVKGENGADVDYSTEKLPTGVGLAHADTVAGAGVIDITASLDAAVDKDYDGVAIENDAAADVADWVAHANTQWGYANKRYRFGFIGETSSLSTANTRSASGNVYHLHVISAEGSPSLPCEVAAAAAVRVWGTERANANYDGMVLCLYPPPNASVYTGAEIESALQSGTTPLMPDETGTRMKIERLVTTKVTTSSAPDYATFDLATPRVGSLMARQIDIRFRRMQGPDFLMDLDPDSPEYVKDRVRDMVIGLHRDFEALRYIQNVETLIDQILVEPNPSVIGRLDLANPIDVVSPFHQLAVVNHVSIGA